MIAAVKHHTKQKKEFWFFVPESLAPRVKKGSRVMCRTSRGYATGTIQKLSPHATAPDGRIPECPIVAVAGAVRRNSVWIPQSMRRTPPSPEKVRKHLDAYIKSGDESLGVVVKSTGTLCDGYISYLLAGVFAIPVINAVFMPTEKDLEYAFRDHVYNAFV